MLVIHWLKNSVRKEILSNPSSFLQLRVINEAKASSDELFEIAAAYDFLQDSKKAKLYCQRAIQRSFQHIPSFYGLALKSFEDHKFEEAQRFYLRAIRMDPQAAEGALYFHQRLRGFFSLPEATHWGRWCLEQLQTSDKASMASQFELGKILFERSEFDQAVPILKALVQCEQYSFEAIQYLSYIYERIYKGAELVENTLQLASCVKDKSDLFFNLAMVCQHEQNRLDLALHFFYLASRSDAQDPGLRFSLEQACLEYIGQNAQPKTPDEYFSLMVAHLYHGSLAVAERYARSLRKRFHWKFPNSFSKLEPSSLWIEWLVKDEGILGEALEAWFGETPVENWRLKTRRPQV